MLQPELASLIDLAREAIIITKLDGTITAWNRYSERLYGYRADEIIGKNIAILIPPNKKDQQSYVHDQIQRGEIIEGLETNRLRKDGRTTDVSLNLSPIRDKLGRVVGILSMVADL